MPGSDQPKLKPSPGRATAPFDAESADSLKVGTRTPSSIQSIESGGTAPKPLSGSPPTEPNVPLERRAMEGWTPDETTRTSPVAEEDAVGRNEGARVRKRVKGQLQPPASSIMRGRARTDLRMGASH